MERGNAGIDKVRPGTYSQCKYGTNEPKMILPNGTLTRSTPTFWCPTGASVQPAHHDHPRNSQVPGQHGFNCLGRHFDPTGDGRVARCRCRSLRTFCECSTPRLCHNGNCPPTELLRGLPPSRGDAEMSGEAPRVVTPAPGPHLPSLAGLPPPCDVPYVFSTSVTPS